eukprot:gene4586-5725_t
MKPEISITQVPSSTTTTSTSNTPPNNALSSSPLNSMLQQQPLSYDDPSSPSSNQGTSTSNTPRPEIIKLSPEEEERKSDELQKILLDMIPVLIKGVESLSSEIDTITSADSLIEKRHTCQVLIDISKILREYPRGMGYRSKTVPPNLSGKPKLIGFRSNMDQLVWEIISKLSILKDFIEFTLDLNLQKLYIVAISIRDAKNSFVNNKCESYIKMAQEQADADNIENSIISININSLISSNGGNHHPQFYHQYTNNNSNSTSPNSQTPTNQSGGESAMSPSKKVPKPQPTVLSRAPKQVMESTRILVDNAINRKCMYREEKANIYREMITDRFNLLNQDPKKYKLNLLQQRRSKLMQSDNGASTDDSSLDSQQKRVESRNYSYSFDQGQLLGSNTNNINGSNSAGGSPSTGEPSPPFSSSPANSPPKSPEGFLGLPKHLGKRLGVGLNHSRSYSDSQQSAYFPSPPLSPRSNEKIQKYYKLLSSSPSSSTTNVGGSAPIIPGQFVGSMSSAIHNSNVDFDLLEWEKLDPDEKSELIQPCRGYKIDIGNSVVKSIQEDLQVMYLEDDEYHYHDDFCQQPEHFNYLGVNKNQPDNPISISVTLQQDSNDVLYIIRTSERDERVRLSLNNGKKELSGKDMLKMIKKSRLNQLAGYKFKEIKDQQFVKELVNFEAKNIHRTFKFGVLYCKDGQGVDENDMYSNSETSESFQEFLRVLGDKIPLKGWTKYRGGLDVKDNTTGVYSIYRKWRDYEIMYHVAPLIPCRAEDEQSVDRKRHLGNDIVLIIFKEGNSTLFDPSIIKSNFNHIFAVIQVDDQQQQNSQDNQPVDNSTQPAPVQQPQQQTSSDSGATPSLVTSTNGEDSTTSGSPSSPLITSSSTTMPTLQQQENVIHYKLSVGCKDEVGLFGPSFPRSHTFSSTDFSEFLLAKLINGERAALRSPVFSHKLKRTRREFLQSFIDEYFNE